MSTHLEGSAKIPKTIWFMWFQGLENAPDVVKRCYDSWRYRNPDWNLVFLDETNYRHYVDVEEVLNSDNHIEVQAKADIIRVNLLARYGGVWADATCFCCQPLDDWLEAYAGAGFFAFDKEGHNRLMANWFMASSLDCYLTVKFADATNRYWLSNRKLRKYKSNNTFLDKTLFRFLLHSPSTTRFWFSFPVTKWLRVYDYMWPPFLFAKLIYEDPRCRRIWHDKKPFGTHVPLGLMKRFKMLEPVTAAAKREFEEQISPLYKLNWRYNVADYPDSNAAYLFQHFAPKFDQSVKDFGTTAAIGSEKPHAEYVG